MTEPAIPGLDDLPAALPTGSRWSRLPLIWILPVVVILAGAFVVVHEKLAQGTSVEIRFHNAEDLETNKTKIRYKDVEIGDVRDIHVSKDRKEVIVTAMIHRDASEYLVDDTRFWVVRPRISAAGVTGLGTMVSGAYISIDVGKSATRSKQFVGLEVPPVVTADLPGGTGPDAKDPRWGRWFRHIEATPKEGVSVLSGVNNEPLLLLSRVGDGRVAQLLSDQLWLWTRGFDGGGPQAELLRRLVYWLMHEPDLEENALSARVEGNRL